MKVLILVLMLFMLSSCVSPTPIPNDPFCGDGYVDAGEACDAGSENGRPCVPDVDSCEYCTQSCELKTVVSASEFDGLSFGIGASQDYLNGNAPDWDAQTYRDLLLGDVVVITSGARLDGLRLDGLDAPVRWESLDAQVDTLESMGKNIKVHYLWNGRSALLPDGFFELAAEERKAWMLEHTRMIAERYAGRVDMYDVVNHPVRDGDEDDYLGTGISKVEAIDLIHRQTRDIDPDAKLVINEGGVLVNNTAIWPGTAANADEYYALIESLVERGTPIDCIGFMTHAIHGEFDETYAEQVLDRFAGFDIPLCITEFDVMMPEGASYDPQSDWWTQQGAEYAQAYELFTTHPRIESIITWELSDASSGRPGAALVTYNDPRLQIEDDGFLRSGNTRERVVEISFDPVNVERAVLYEEGGAARGISIYVDAGYVHAYLWNDGASGPTFEPLHLSGPYDGPTQVRFVHKAGAATELFIDGVLADSGTALGLYPHTGLTIGGADYTRFHDGAFGVWGYHYAGVIDSVRVWNATSTEATPVIDLDIESLEGFSCVDCPQLSTDGLLFEDFRYREKPAYESFKSYAE